MTTLLCPRRTSRKNVPRLGDQKEGGEDPGIVAWKIDGGGPIGPT